MIQQTLLFVSALLATAGSAFPGSSPPDQREPAAALQAGQWIDLELDDGSVETLVVHDRRGLAGAVGESVETKPVLLLGLHGFGMDASQMATLVPLEPDFPHLYLAPQGFHTLPDGSLAWFPITVEGDQVVVDPEDVRGFAERFVRYVETTTQRFGIDEVLIVGYSQGGAAVFHLAATQPELAAGFVAFAGSALPGTFAAETGRNGARARLFVGHGTRDPLVSTEQQRSDIERLRDLGHEVTYREYAVPHVVSTAGRRDATTWLERQRR